MKYGDVLATGGKDAQLGALLYQGALHAERTRSELFQKHEYPAPPAAESTHEILQSALTASPASVNSGQNPSTTPNPVDTPLPPLNFSHTGNKCPSTRVMPPPIIYQDIERGRSAKKTVAKLPFKDDFKIADAIG